MAISRYKVAIMQMNCLENLLKDHTQALKQKYEKQIPAKTKKFSLVPDVGKFLTQSIESESHKQKVSVFAKVNFLKIGTIDTSHDRYSAEVMIQLRWREPLLDSLETQLSRGNDLSEFWNPKIIISNGIGELKYDTINFIQIDENGKAWICEVRKTNAAQFFELMELHKFPFDTQDLTVIVSSELLSQELEFIPDERSSVNIEAFSAAQEWQVHEVVEVWTKFTTKTVQKKQLVYPCFCVATRVARKPQFFIYNVIIIMFAICSLSFATFTVELEMTESRLPLTFLLVLTTVTFKSVVNKSLPKISYLTYLDKYVLGSMVILCCICIWQSISGSLVNNLTQTNLISNSTVCSTLKHKSTELSRTIDTIVMGSLGIIYLFFHACFFVFIRLQKKKQRKEIQSSKEEASTKDQIQSYNYKKIKKIEPVHN